MIPPRQVTVVTTPASACNWRDPGRRLGSAPVDCCHGVVSSPVRLASLVVVTAAGKTEVRQNSWSSAGRRHETVSALIVPEVRTNARQCWFVFLLVCLFVFYKRHRPIFFSQSKNINKTSRPLSYFFIFNEYDCFFLFSSISTCIIMYLQKHTLITFNGLKKFLHSPQVLSLFYIFAFNLAAFRVTLILGVYI